MHRLTDETLIVETGPPTAGLNHKNYCKMIATLIEGAKSKFTSSHRKEGKCYFESFTALSIGQYSDGEKKLIAAVELRLYGTGTKYYACIWIHGREFNRSGSGSAGGYGYHKPSAAASEAIRNAGIELSEGISGVGDEAISEAVKAIAVLAGYPDSLVFKAHP